MQAKDRLSEIFNECLDATLAKGALYQVSEVRNFVITDTVAHYLFELFMTAHVPFPVMDDIEELLREETDDLYLKASYGIFTLEELAFRRGVSTKKAV